MHPLSLDNDNDSVWDLFIYNIANKKYFTPSVILVPTWGKYKSLLIWLILLNIFITILFSKIKYYWSLSVTNNAMCILVTLTVKTELLIWYYYNILTNIVSITASYSIPQTLLQYLFYL